MGYSGSKGATGYDGSPPYVGNWLQGTTGSGYAWNGNTTNPTTITSLTFDNLENNGSNLTNYFTGLSSTGQI